jgi:uncharacterized protein (TIGR03437 family)
VTLIGVKLKSASLGGRKVPVLSAENDETQIQVPFETAATESVLEFDSGAGIRQISVPVEPTAPAIFADREGAPFLVDSDSGELVDPLAPLQAGQTLQILMTGLGPVEPSWPSGEKAPAQGAPKVVAPLRVWLNGKTIELVRGELASGYIGFYLVEVKLPALLDDGIVPLAVEAGGRMSNTILVRVTSVR